MTYADYQWDAGGWFRQRDLTVRAVYDRVYVESRYAAIDEKVRALSARRLAVLDAFVPGGGSLLDFGAGSFRFVEAAAGSGAWSAWGHDVTGIRHPRGRDPSACRWTAATFFDSLEHLPDPAAVVRALAARWVMASVPWCHRPADPDWFMAWKHRRPGEHLHHFGRASLDRFFAALGYRPVMHSTFEDEFRPNPAQAEPNVLTALYVRAGTPAPG